MADKILPDEKAIIAEALRRKQLNEPSIPAEKVRVFRKLLIEKLKTTGRLEKEYADEQLRKLIAGEL